MGWGSHLAVSRSIVEVHGAAVPDRSSSTSVSGVVKVRRDCAQTKSYRHVLRPQLEVALLWATTEDIVAGANGMLENAVVFVADGLGDRTFQPPAQLAVLEQKG